MEFEVVEVIPERDQVKIGYGDLVLTVKVMEGGARVHVVRPPFVFIRGDAFRVFISTVRQAWRERKMIDGQYYE